MEASLYYRASKQRDGSATSCNPNSVATLYSRSPLQYQFSSRLLLSKPLMSISRSLQAAVLKRTPSAEILTPFVTKRSDCTGQPKLRMVPRLQSLRSLGGRRTCRRLAISPGFNLPRSFAFAYQNSSKAGKCESNESECTRGSLTLLAIPERLLIFHAGTGRTVFVGALKVTTIFLFSATLLFIAPALYNDPEQPSWVAPMGKSFK